MEAIDGCGLDGELDSAGPLPGPHWTSNKNGKKPRSSEWRLKVFCSTKSEPTVSLETGAHGPWNACNDDHKSDEEIPELTVVFQLIGVRSFDQAVP